MTTLQCVIFAFHILICYIDPHIVCSTLVQSSCNTSVPLNWNTSACMYQSIIVWWIWVNRLTSAVMWIARVISLSISLTELYTFIQIGRVIAWLQPLPNSGTTTTHNVFACVFECVWVGHVWPCGCWTFATPVVALRNYGLLASMT